MSSFEPTTEGITFTPQMSRRIKEIIEEKGLAFSTQALAMRVKINRETLRKKLRGEREIYMYELRRVAEALHMSVERLMKTDTLEMESELKSIFDALIDPDKTMAVAQKILWTEATNEAFANGGYVDMLKHRALEIALYLKQIAIGTTEKSIALNELGRVYYHLNRFEDSHSAWLEAYNYASKLSNKRNTDKEPLFAVITNLMISFSIRKEYSYLAEILTHSSKLFESEPHRAAVISYSLAKIAENKGNFEEARSQYEAYIRFSEVVPNKLINYGKAKHNSARFEYRQGNYQRALELFEDALSIFEHHHFEKITCLKDYSKNLLKLGEHEKAELTILHSIGLFDDKSYVDLRAQYMILLSIARQVPEHAVSVIEQTKIAANIKKVACKYLIDFFDKKGDSTSAMKYYRAMKHFSHGQYDALDEEEL